MNLIIIIMDPYEIANFITKELNMLQQQQQQQEQVNVN